MEVFFEFWKVNRNNLKVFCFCFSLAGCEDLPTRRMWEVRWWRKWELQQLRAATGTQPSDGLVQWTGVHPNWVTQVSWALAGDKMSNLTKEKRWMSKQVLSWLTRTSMLYCYDFWLQGSGRKIHLHPSLLPIWQHSEEWGRIIHKSDWIKNQCYTEFSTASVSC